MLIKFQPVRFSVREIYGDSRRWFGGDELSDAISEAVAQFIQTMLEREGLPYELVIDTSCDSAEVWFQRTDDEEADMINCKEKEPEDLRTFLDKLDAGEMCVQ